MFAASASAAVGDFQPLADSPVNLTSVAIDPATNLIYAQEDGGVGFYRYDPRTNVWSPLADSPINSGNNGGATYLGGKIYTVYTGNSANLGVYDIAAGTWSTIPNPLGQGTGNITAVGDSLYLVVHNAFVRYTPSTDTTTPLANAPNFTGVCNSGFDRWGGLAPYNGKIYGTQGDGCDGFAVYDIAGNSWSELPKVPDDVTGSEGTDNASLLGVAIDPLTGTFYTYGGYGESHFFRYDIAGGAWTTIDYPPSDLEDGGMVYVTLPGLRGIYSVVGESGPGFYRYVTREAAADLALTKTADVATATVGDGITYTLTVKNNGPDAADNVAVTDTIPSNTTFTSSSPSQGSCSGGQCSLGALASGASATVTVTVTASAAGTATNSASVSADTADPDGANNSASASTQVAARPVAAAAPAATKKTTTKCKVPNLRNKTVQQARRLLVHSHCRLGAITITKASARRTGSIHVLSQSVKAGTAATLHRHVAVTTGRTGPLRARRVSPSFTG